jgi:hypothetical protein
VQPLEDNKPERVPWWRGFVRMWRDPRFYCGIIFTNVHATGLVAVLAYVRHRGTLCEVSQRQEDTASRGVTPRFAKRWWKRMGLRGEFDASFNQLPPP